MNQNPTKQTVPTISGEVIDTDAAIEVLDDAYARAVAQRLAAEALLGDARAVEERLTAAASMAREANARGSARRLASAAEEARQAEELAARRADECAHAVERAATERAEGESLERRHQAELEGAAAAAASAEQRAAEARRALEEAQLELAETRRRFEDLSSSEHLAIAESRRATEELRARTLEREQAEAAARTAIEEADNALSPARGALDQLRALEARTGLHPDAARRIAERRAADAARNAVN